MRPTLIGLAAALMLSMLAPSGAWAADKAPPVSKESRDAGMKAAPGLITDGKLDCQLSDARKLGDSVDAKTKVKSSFYELACKGNEGLIVQASAGVTPVAFTCVEAGPPVRDGKPNASACILPDNADPKAGLAPYIAKAGVACTPDQARPIGHNSTITDIELVCHEAPGGYILEISAPPRLTEPAKMNPCVGYPEEGKVTCTLTDRATQMAVIDRLVAASGKPCAVKANGRRFIGVAQTSGSTYFEVACDGGKGYVLEQAATGALTKAIDCVDADAIAGGCTLTDTRQAKTEQNNLYSKLAKKAGYDCDVSGYAPLPPTADIPAHADVVEVTCANRADGAIAVFPASSSDPAMIWDCAHSELEGYRCSLSKAAAAYPKLTAELESQGKKSCTVSNARAVGVTADKKGYVEVGCSDGLQGYMIEYAVAPLKVTSVIICNEAKGIAGGCTLPGNKKS